VRQQREKKKRRYEIQSRGFNCGEHIWKACSAHDSHGGIKPPEDKSNGTHLRLSHGRPSGHHWDNAGEGNADGGETSSSIDIGAQRSHDLLRIHHDASNAGNEFHQEEDDGKHLEDIDDDLKAPELEGELMKDDGDSAGALRDEESLG